MRGRARETWTRQCKIAVAAATNGAETAMRLATLYFAWAESTMCSSVEFECPTSMFTVHGMLHGPCAVGLKY